MAHCLIAGCGDIGGGLAEHLMAAGHQVWAIRRHVAKLPVGVTGLAIDLTEPFSLTAIDKPLDWVFYTAAAGGGDEAHYRNIYVHGLTHLCHALKESDQSPRHLVFTGSTSVYGQDDGSWVDETSETTPQRYNGKILLEAEDVLRKAPFTTTSVRLGGIYGPGRTWLIRKVQAGEPVAHKPVRYSNRIHREDAIAALAHVAQLPNPADCYVGVDNEPAPFHEVLAWLADQLDLPHPPSKGAKPSRRGGNKRCRNARLRDTGFQFQYPSYREGYAMVIEQMSS